MIGKDNQLNKILNNLLKGKNGKIVTSKELEKVKTIRPYVTISDKPYLLTHKKINDNRIKLNLIEL